MLNSHEICQRIASRGLPAQGYLHKLQIIRACNQLADDYNDNLLLQQLINQSAPQNTDSANLKLFAKKVVEAQQILQKRVNGLKQKQEQTVKRLGNKLQQLNQIPLNETIRRQQLNQAILLLEQDKANNLLELSESQGELDLLRKIFSAQYSKTLNSKRNNPEQQSSPLNESGALLFLMYLTLFQQLLYILISFAKTDYFNLCAVTAVLLIFLLNYFQPIYLKFCMAMLVLSQVLDSLWLALYLKTWWNPPAFAQYNSSIKSFYRFCVVITILLLLSKLASLFLLYRHRQARECTVRVSSQYKLHLGAYSLPPITTVIKQGLNLQ